MTEHSIVSSHSTRTLAYIRKHKLERWQMLAAVETESPVPGEPYRKKLRDLGLDAGHALIVRKEPYRRFKWAVLQVI